MHEVQFMSRKAQFMKSQISIHAVRQFIEFALQTHYSIAVFNFQDKKAHRLELSAQDGAVRTLIEFCKFIILVYSKIFQCLVFGKRNTFIKLVKWQRRVCRGSRHDHRRGALRTRPCACHPDWKKPQAGNPLSYHPQTYPIDSDNSYLFLFTILVSVVPVTISM